MLPVRLAPVVVKLCDADAVPVTVVNPGNRLVEALITGTPAWSIVNVNALDVAAPVCTVIVAEPAEAMSAAVIAAVSCPEELKVVVLLLPFQRTMDADVKLLPPTTRLNAPELAILDGGESELMNGVATVILILSNRAVWLRFVLPFQ